MPVSFDVAGLLMVVPLLMQVAPAAGAAGTATINAAGALNFFTALLGLAQTVGVPAFAVSAAWNGYQLMFSTSPRNQDGAKEHLKWSVIGLVLILAANQVAEVIKQAAGATATGGG